MLPAGVDTPASAFIQAIQTSSMRLCYNPIVRQLNERDSPVLGIPILSDGFFIHTQD